MAIKTLHLTNYWHPQSGGIATFYRNLMKAANLHRRQMILVVPGIRDELVEVGSYCRIYKIAAPPSPFNREYRTIYPREFIFPGSKVQRILASERPDLVELCDKYSLVYLGLLLRQRLLQDLSLRPILVGLTCERMDENFATYASRAWWGPAFTRFYMRHIYFPAFDHHIAVSERTAAELKDVSKGHVVRRGVWARPMGVDVEHFSPAKRSLGFRKQFIARYRLPQDAILLLYVGRLVPEKNLELLISTMVELRDREQNFCLIMAGDGISRSSLEAAARSQVPKKIVFLGHISDREELARVYANCDVFVHPNPEEPFGIAPLEAMASGLPLVAPDRGGVTEYANAGNSFLAPPTPQAFARAIMQACRADTDTAQKTQAARKAAEALAWPKVTESFLHLYEELHRVANGQKAIEAAQPAFISSPAETTRAGGIRFVATIARSSFLAYVQAHRIAHSSTFSNRRVCNPTKMGDFELNETS
jgi:alpha-1,6-mannosyltransferase